MYNYAFVFATFSRAFPLKVFRRIFAMHCLHFQSLLYSYMPSEGYFKFRLISVIYHVFPGIILFVRCRGNPPPLPAGFNSKKIKKKRVLLMASMHHTNLLHFWPR